MEYKVREWTFNSPHTTSCFSYVNPTNAIKQAIINNIRENGYIFDMRCGMVPVLNTGEAVYLDYDLCEELVSKAYGLNHEQYLTYLNYAINEPKDASINTTEYNCQYPFKRIVWINDETFDDFKASILNSNNNVDIIPSDYIQLKKGDIVRYTSVDETKYFEVKVKEFIPKTIFSITNIKEMKKTDTQSIIDLLTQNKKLKTNEPLIYRYENLNGDKIYKEFKRIYGTFVLEMIYSNDFNCNICAIVFDKDASFTPTILETPANLPLKKEVWEKIDNTYKKALLEKEKREQQYRQKILELKEKIAKRKNQSTIE